MGAEVSRPPPPMVTFPEEDRRSSLVPPPRPRLQQSLSLDLTGLAMPKKNPPHFSDYNFYPDRFHAAIKIGAMSAQTPPPEIWISGASPPASDSSPPQSLQTSSLGTGHLISKHNFRFRTLSGGSPLDLPPAPSSTRSSTPIPEENDIDDTQIFNSRRKRSNSLNTENGNLKNGKLYYFDFSFLPEKDPRFEADQKRKRIRNLSQGDEEETVEVVMEKGKGAGPRRTSAQAKYSFFDYSLIPDKMERVRKPNQDLVVHKK